MRDSTLRFGRCILLFLVLLGIMLSAGLTEAVPLLNPINGHHYEWINAPASWFDASTLAQTSTFMGVSGHLATVSSQQENDFLISSFANDPNGRFWIGGFQNQSNPNYSEPTGGWEWVTGEPFIYTNWGPGEPNDSIPTSPPGLNEDGIELFGTGEWNDFTRITTVFIIKEYFVEYDTPPTPIPEPSTYISILAIAIYCLISIGWRRRRKSAS